MLSPCAIGVHRYATQVVLQPKEAFQPFTVTVSASFDQRKQSRMRRITVTVPRPGLRWIVNKDNRPPTRHLPKRSSSVDSGPNYRLNR